MLFALEALPAKHGDCLLLHYGSARAPQLVVIDGGPGGVYGASLKPRLEAIRARKNLSEVESLPVEMLMVSHVDDDHINGVLQLTRDLIIAFDERQPLPLGIRRVWHNSFDRVLGTTPRSLSSLLASAERGPEPDSGEIAESDKAKLAARMMLASVAQGDRLRQDIAKLGLASNPPFADVVIARGDATSVVVLPGGLKITVVGPLKEDLVALQKEHDKWVRAQEKSDAERKAAAKALAAYVDDSVANLSSIVVLAELDGKRMLLTGDARGDKILKGLEQAGIVARNKTLHVDMMKLPHHGSDHNVDDDFFRRITADHYVASGDGKHGNPERKTLEMLFKSRNKDDAFALHLTYGLEAIDKGRKIQREIDNERAENKGKPANPWNDKKDGLRPFITKMKTDYSNFRLVVPKSPSGVSVSLGGDAIPY